MPRIPALKVGLRGNAFAGGRDHGVCTWAKWARVGKMGEAQGLVHMPRRYIDLKFIQSFGAYIISHLLISHHLI
jgi:hypothetical protein